MPGPFDAYLTLRGIKTLAVRMERHSDNAEKVVEFLGDTRQIETVLYPGLPDHPGHDVAAKQMSALRRHGVGAGWPAAAGGAQDFCARTRCSPSPSRSAASSR